jgi:tetraacyldisaccharide 4'-kinase
MALRRHAYERGLLKSFAADLPVVSIGNLEVGGTGKTPFTISLAEALNARGHRVAIVTRGYGGKLIGPLKVEANHSAAQVGDEPLLMVRAGLTVIKAPDRVAGAKLAKELGASLILLDDGFQHRRLKRDLDIVLVSRDLGKARVLPFGCLREPLSALEKADIVVHTKAATGKNRARLVSRDLIDIQGRTRPLADLHGKQVLAVSAIGQPESFHAELENLGARLATRTFRDHHAYSRADIAELQASTAELIVTTEKDLVKLEPAWLDERWLSLRVAMQIDDLAQIIEEIEDLVQNRRLPRP